MAKLVSYIKTIVQKCKENNQATNYTIYFYQSNVHDVQMYTVLAEINRLQIKYKCNKKLITCSKASVSFGHVIER